MFVMMPETVCGETWIIMVGNCYPCVYPLSTWYHRMWPNIPGCLHICILQTLKVEMAWERGCRKASEGSDCTVVTAVVNWPFINIIIALKLTLMVTLEWWPLYYSLQFDLLFAVYVIINMCVNWSEAALVYWPTSSMGMSQP